MCACVCECVCVCIRTVHSKFQMGGYIDYFDLRGALGFSNFSQIQMTKILPRFFWIMQAVQECPWGHQAGIPIYCYILLDSLSHLSIDIFRSCKMLTYIYRYFWIKLDKARYD